MKKTEINIIEPNHKDALIGLDALTSFIRTMRPNGYFTHLSEKQYESIQGKHIDNLYEIENWINEIIRAKMPKPQDFIFDDMPTLSQSTKDLFINDNTNKVLIKGRIATGKTFFYLPVVIKLLQKKFKKYNPKVYYINIYPEKKLSGSYWDQIDIQKYDEDLITDSDILICDDCNTLFSNPDKSTFKGNGQNYLDVINNHPNVILTCEFNLTDNFKWTNYVNINTTEKSSFDIDKKEEINIINELINILS